MNVASNIAALKRELPANVTLVAVSKTKPIEVVKEAYDAGQRIFGENKVQELSDKYELLPKDINWHFIGHLQTNKVKFIAPFVSLIHSVDRLKLIKEIGSRAAQQNRTIDCLLQVHIAQESHKFGFDQKELRTLIENETFQQFPHIRIRGLMGMATFTDDKSQLMDEFHSLNSFFISLKNNYFNGNQHFDTLSMGMSNDFPLAIQEGSNMVRVGSAIFGARN